jgi:hypothetical protein
LTIVFGFAIVGAIIIVIYSLEYPSFHMSDQVKNNITIAHVQQGIYTFVLKDTLPVATTLIGFAGGLATAFFGDRAKDEKLTKESVIKSIDESDLTAAEKEKAKKLF